MRYFEEIKESNKLSLNKPLNTDMIYYSELNEWYTTDAFRSFSIKYVIDQSIHYKKDAREYKVNAGHYMLACRYSDVKAYFSSSIPVRSVCIDICPGTFTDACKVLLLNQQDIDDVCTNYFRYPEFYESINPVNDSLLGQKLQSLVPLIHTHNTGSIGKEWFLDLVEKVIYKEYGNYLALKNIHSLKASTKKEILRRLEIGKDYMDESFLEIKEIKQVAEFCNMSEYHFFRSFKQAYGFTPFQYLTIRRMELAKELVMDKEKKLSEIALICNFPDVFTFSKAFKRYYGMPPSAMR